VLDAGCGSGVIARELARRGAVVTGIDRQRHPSWEGEHPTLRYVVADLEAGLPGDVQDEYDVIVAADVLEHLRAPEELLRALVSRLAPSGQLILSVPNISHWYPRLRIGAGRFRYDRRGILDRDHLRFFTRDSAVEMVRAAGARVEDVLVTGTPVEVMRRSAAGAPTASPDDAVSGIVASLGRLSAASARAWPSLFAYQVIVVATAPSASPGAA
jgi:predicted TPR repeat methyltransferase